MKPFISLTLKLFLSYNQITNNVLELCTMGKQHVFGQRLAYLRQEQGMSQEEIAEKFSVTRPAVGNWEKEALPREPILSGLAELFDVSVDYLLGRTDIRHPSKGFYHDPEVAEYAQKVFEDPNLRILFDASKKLKKDDIDFVVQMVKKMQPKDDDYA
jgi:transcriptional regulator with XRE-family HTH domain